MLVAPDVFMVLHSILLLGFISVTSLLMLMTVANRLRVDRVLLSWRAGHLFGLPLWPTSFIALALVFLFISVLTGQPIHPFVFGGYLTGGLFWFTSAMLTSSVLITEHGIRRNVNLAGQVVAWGQVVDYFEQARDRRYQFVFFYLDGHGQRLRLEVVVPPACRQPFVQIVKAKLDARFDFSMQQLYGNKALEG